MISQIDYERMPDSELEVCIEQLTMLGTFYGYQLLNHAIIEEQAEMMQRLMQSTETNDIFRKQGAAKALSDIAERHDGEAEEGSEGLRVRMILDLKSLLAHRRQEREEGRSQ